MLVVDAVLGGWDGVLPTPALEAGVDDPDTIAALLIPPMVGLEAAALPCSLSAPITTPSPAVAPTPFPGIGVGLPLLLLLVVPLAAVVAVLLLLLSTLLWLPGAVAAVVDVGQVEEAALEIVLGKLLLPLLDEDGRLALPMAVAAAAAVVVVVAEALVEEEIPVEA